MAGSENSFWTAHLTQYPSLGRFLRYRLTLNYHQQKNRFPAEGRPNASSARWRAC